MASSRSARPFQERLGLARTRSLPLPRLDLGALKINTLPLDSPFPAPLSRLEVEGSPPPDRGVTRAWPPSE